jgi:glycosyltransferase involved in cell wall biosynthesis
MLVYLNFTAREGPYGGANSFLRTLVGELAGRGVTTTSDASAPFDVALLNALTDGLDVEAVQRLADRGRPLVHRKTGYLGRGPAGQRQVVGGVVLGDAQQVELGPYLAHTVFQSRYSRDVFVEAGFSGSYTVIANGVDEAVFHADGHGRWRPGEPLRVVISTWSADENKGHPEYRRVDDELAGRRDVTVTLVGHIPEGTSLRNIRVLPPQPPQKLAETLRRHHVLLQLAKWETCSNALIEGLNCGLPAVYLDSGANAEVAAPYGVAYDGDLLSALDAIRAGYDELVAGLHENPYRISVVADRYLEVLEAVAAGREPSCGETVGG